MYGYAGKMIHINLTKSNIIIESLKKGFTSQYLGGKGFGAKTLIEKITPKTGPYDPANLLIFATGPVNGTTLSGAAKLIHSVSLKVMINSADTWVCKEH